MLTLKNADASLQEILNESHEAVIQVKGGKLRLEAWFGEYFYFLEEASVPVHTEAELCGRSWHLDHDEATGHMLQGGELPDVILRDTHLEFEAAGEDEVRLHGSAVLVPDPDVSDGPSDFPKTELEIDVLLRIEPPDWQGEFAFGMEMSVLDERQEPGLLGQLLAGLQAMVLQEEGAPELVTLFNCDDESALRIYGPSGALLIEGATYVEGEYRQFVLSRPDVDATPVSFVPDSVNAPLLVNTNELFTGEQARVILEQFFRRRSLPADMSPIWGKKYLV